MSEQGGEKTEEPTPKRLREARKRGEVAMSRDMIGAGIYLAVFATLSFTAGAWVTRLVAYMHTVFAVAHKPGAMGAHGGWAFQALFDATLAPLVAAMALAIGLGFMQTGGLFSFEALKLDPQRLMPSLKKVFNLSALMEVVKGFVKIGLAAAVAWVAIKPLLGAFVNLTGASPRSILVVLGYATEELGKQMALVVVVIGAADMLWQRHQYRKKMMMTREEVKREYKESEGDPEHKAARRRAHEDVAFEGMMESVRDADVVVINPTHLACALRYDPQKDGSPRLLAKGKGYVAQRIRRIAREAGIPVVQDISLARALHELRVNTTIPPELFDAAAALLRWVEQEALARGEVPAWRRQTAGDAA